MNRTYALLSAGFALTLMLGAASASAAQATYGFAAYQVSTNSPSGPQSALVNETVSQSSKVGYSDLVLQIYDGPQNLTYSRLVNATYSLLPYFPAVGNQSFDYSNGTQYSISVNVTTAGSVTQTFGSAQYSLRVFSVAVSGSYGAKTFSFNGTVETFPSDLVYSATVGNGTYGFQATLQGTDLPLTASSSASSAADYAGAGIGTGAVVLGGALLLRRRTKKVEADGERKPLHWVD